MDVLAPGVARQQSVEPFEHGAEPRVDLLGRRDGNIVLSEVDTCLQQRNEFDQAILDRLHRPRDRALQLLGGNARLIQRGGLDQVAHGFSAGQVDPSVQIGAQRELAGLGGARAGAQGSADAMAEHDGRAVAGDLHHVFSSVAARRGKEGDDHLVHRGAVFIEQEPVRRAPRLPLMLFGEAQDRFSDRTGLRA